MKKRFIPLFPSECTLFRRRHRRVVEKISLRTLSAGKCRKMPSGSLPFQRVEQTVVYE